MITTNRTYFHPKLLFWAAISILILSAGLAFAAKPTTPAVAWPVIALAGDQTQADVAYSPDTDRYLVVSRSHEGDNWSIYGQILDGQGFAVTPLTPLAAGGGEERGHPAVAYNADGDEFLVVWEETFLSQDWDVRGIRVTTTGIPIGDSFPIAARNNPERSPDVAYNDVKHEYMVIWKQTVGEGDIAMPDISGQRLSPTGEAIGSDFPVTFSNAEESSAKIAFLQNVDQYIVVWEEPGAGEDMQVRGQRISWQGDWVGSVMDIATGDAIQESPSVAYNASDSQFLVTWAEQPTHAHRDIKAQRFSANGAAVGSTLTISSGENDYRDAPDVTFNAVKDAYLVVWEYEINDADHDILSRYVNADGSLPGEEYPLSAALNIEARPAVAAGSADSYLTVWEQEGADYDIYATMLGEPATPSPTPTPTTTPPSMHQVWLPMTISP